MPGRKKNAEKVSYQHGLAAEREGDLEGAAGIYEAVVKAKPMQLAAQHRLMIVYRKLKLADKEVQAINNAIKSFESETENAQRQWIKDHQLKAEASRALAASLGLLNDNGLPFYQDDTLARWKNRLATLQQRLTKAKTKKVKTAAIRSLKTSNRKTKR